MHMWYLLRFCTCRKFLDLDIAVHTDVVHKFASVVTSQLLSIIAKLRRLFLVEDMIDSLKVMIFKISDIVFYTGYLAQKMNFVLHFML